MVHVIFLKKYQQMRLISIQVREQDVQILKQLVREGKDTTGFMQSVITEYESTIDSAIQMAKAVGDGLAAVFVLGDKPR